MGRFATAALALAAAGLLACSRAAEDKNPSTTTPGGGACTIQHATVDVCVETSEAGCASWGARKTGSTHQFAATETCARLGYAHACQDGFMHREACTYGACATLPTCDTCTAQLACGWCGVGDCNEGTASGMISGSCSGWAFTPSSCPPPAEPVDPCLAKRPLLCAGCTATAGCGWCPSTGSCVTGTSSGPSVGSCAPAPWGSWTTSSTSCPVPDPCATRYGCETCVALAGCAYCASSFTCRSTTSIAPNDQTCSDWRFSAASCTANPNACSDCLSACRGLSGCCTGTGCICDGPC